MSKEFDIAKKNLDFIKEEIKSNEKILTDDVKKVAKTIMAYRPDKNDITLESTTISWKIDVLDQEAKIVIDNQVDEVTNVYIEVEGKPINFIKNGKLSDDFNMTFGATLKF